MDCRKCKKKGQLCRLVVSPYVRIVGNLRITGAIRRLSVPTTRSRIQRSSRLSRQPGFLSVSVLRHLQLAQIFPP